MTTRPFRVARSLRRQVAYGPAKVDVANRHGLRRVLTLDLGSLYTKAGATQLFELAYRDQDFADYKDIVKAGNEYQGDPAAFVADLAAYRKWRTWQFSDHYPLWVQLRIDFSDEYLATVGS